MSLSDTGGNRITPPSDPSEYSIDTSAICQTQNGSANSIYECENTEQLIKYYHASLGSHPKTNA